MIFLAMLLLNEWLCIALAFPDALPQLKQPGGKKAGRLWDALLRLRTAAQITLIVC